MVRFVELPVIVFEVEPPIVTIPLAVVMVCVPLPPKAISPVKETIPVLVLMLPPFQVKGPPIVNDALVDEVAARSCPKVIVLVDVRTVGSLKLRFACEVIAPE